MKTAPNIVRLTVASGCCALGALSHAADPSLEWRETANSLALVRGGTLLWQHNHDKAASKTCFHPLSTAGGFVLTADKPADHPWHHGLWWSWKFINGVNYWEENAAGQSAGRTVLRELHIDKGADHGATLRLTLAYHPAGGQEDVMTEAREIVLSPPDANGGYTIRWTSEFKALVALKLDRTPLEGEPQGKAYGGYAGLALRLSPMMKNPANWKFVTEPQGQALAHGQCAPAVAIHGPEARITITAAPANPRMPSPWYVAQNMPFLQPAPLFERALDLKAGQSLRLAYSIEIRAGAGK